MEKKFKDIEQGSLVEEGYFCEDEQGTFFDEENENKKERQDDDLVSYLTSSRQPEDLVVKTPNGSMEFYVFNINECCVNVGYFSVEEGRLFETVLKKKRPKVVLVDSMKEEQRRYSIMKESEIQTSHRIKQIQSFVIKEGETEMTCIGNLVEGVTLKKGKVVSAKNKEKLTIESSQRKGQLLKIARDKEHSNIILLKCEEEIRVLEELMKEPKIEEEVTRKEEEMLITSNEIEAVIKEMKDILSPECEYEIQGQQGSVVEVIGFKDTENGKEWNCSQQLERYVGKGREDLNQCRMEGVYDSTNYVMRRQGVRYPSILDIFVTCATEEETNSKSFVALTHESVQQQHQSSLDREIDSLMELLLKKYNRRRYMRRRQAINGMGGWTEAKVKGKLNDVLQTRVWKLGATKEDNQRYEQEHE